MEGRVSITGSSVEEFKQWLESGTKTLRLKKEYVGRRTNTDIKVHYESVLERLRDLFQEQDKKLFENLSMDDLYCYYSGRQGPYSPELKAFDENLDKLYYVKQQLKFYSNECYEQ